MSISHIKEVLETARNQGILAAAQQDIAVALTRNTPTAKGLQGFIESARENWTGEHMRA